MSPRQPQKLRLKIRSAIRDGVFMDQEIKKTLWAAADKLRSNMDAAEYKHLVLGLVFLKYISDAFDERRIELKKAASDPKDDLYLPDAADREMLCEDRDSYTMAHIFWVPAIARWASNRIRHYSGVVKPQLPLAASPRRRSWAEQPPTWHPRTTAAPRGQRGMCQPNTSLPFKRSWLG